MNPHYHHSPYPDLNSPHSPILDGIPNNYHGHGGPQGGPPNGLIMNSHHEHLHSHPAFAGGQLSHHGNGPNSLQNYHHHHHHHLINHNNHNNGNDNVRSNQPPHVTCVVCGHVIKDRWIFRANDRHFHQHCLKCECCHTVLAGERTCYTRNDMILCKNDYLRILGNIGQCSACSESISAAEMVMKINTSPVPNSPAQNSYPHRAPVFHMKCFACSKCGSKLVAGDRYYLSGNNLICEQDWKMNFKGSQNMGAGQQQATGTTIRKGKVGRPRRSRD